LVAGGAWLELEVAAGGNTQSRRWARATPCWRSASGGDSTRCGRRCPAV